MSLVTVSPDYQVTIPPELRAALGVKPGQRIELTSSAGRLELGPEVNLVHLSMAQLQGCLHGIDTSFDREDDRV